MAVANALEAQWAHILTVVAYARLTGAALPYEAHAYVQFLLRELETARRQARRSRYE